jgi:iron(III) transport system ATP-binding protein
VRLRVEIRALQQRLGVTTILVTHDQEEALSMADRIVVMNTGRIEQVGTPRAVYETPATSFVADFVGKVNVLSAVAQSEGLAQVGGLALRLARTHLVPGTALTRAAGIPNAFVAKVAKVEFLGPYCLLWLHPEVAAAPPLVASVSRHAVDAGGLEPGATIAVTLPAAALRILD